MSRLDYSKWDHIEVSDDEDDTHPNVDTPSLFRWRHQARVERTETEQVEKAVFEKGKYENLDKLQHTKDRLEKLEKEGGDKSQIAEVREELKKLEDDHQEWKQKEEELAKKERLTPWNVDTLSKDGFQKTVINKYQEQEEEITEDEDLERQKKFVGKYEKEIKKFGMYKRLEDSQQFLIDHPHLTCEYTANYLVIWSIDLEEEGKSSLMHQIAHQTITMQFLLELAKNLKEDPRSCIRPFFTKMKKADVQYQAAFNDELESFKGRIRERAEARRQRAREELAKQEEEEREARLGPGGLDPIEVMESLPETLQKCFENQDVPLLQETLKTLTLEEAKYHMDRCAKSGLWVPSPEAKPVLEGKDVDGEDEDEDEDGGEEDVYVDAVDH